MNVPQKGTLQWETKIDITEITPQAIWPISKSLLQRNEPRIPTSIHGPWGLKFHPSEKANAIADSLENQLTHHDLCHETHERRVEAGVQALLKAVDKKTPERVRPCDVKKLITSLKLIKPVHSGLLYELSKLEFSISLIKLTSSFLSKRKLSVSVEGEMSAPREMRAGAQQGSVLFSSVLLYALNMCVCVCIYIYIYIYIWCHPNPWCLPGPLCRRHVSVGDR
jgi:hypothetical protein